jgi:hypothetical protein
MDKNNKSDKFKINELLAEYSKTFKKPLGLVTIFINRDELLQTKLINLLESSISTKKELSNKDIEKFYPTTEGIVI